MISIFIEWLELQLQFIRRITINWLWIDQAWLMLAEPADHATETSTCCAIDRYSQTNSFLFRQLQEVLLDARFSESLQVCLQGNFHFVISWTASRHYVSSRGDLSFSFPAAGLSGLANIR
jgi:hypothetical protein